MTLCEEDRTEEFLETPRAPLGRPEPRSACTCGRGVTCVWCVWNGRVVAVLMKVLPFVVRSVLDRFQKSALVISEGVLSLYIYMVCSL